MQDKRTIKGAWLILVIAGRSGYNQPRSILLIPEDSSADCE